MVFTSVSKWQMGQVPAVVTHVAHIIDHSGHDIVNSNKNELCRRKGGKVRCINLRISFYFYTDGVYY